MRKRNVRWLLTLGLVILASRFAPCAELRTRPRGPYGLVATQPAERVVPRTVVLRAFGLVVSLPSAAERDASRALLDRLRRADGGAASVGNGVVLQTSFLDSQCAPGATCGGSPCNEVLLLWDEFEAKTENLTVFVNGLELGAIPPLPAGEVPGTNLVFIGGLPGGPSTFRVESPDGTAAEANIVVLDNLPFAEPQNVTCEEDPSLGPGCNLVITLESEGPFPSFYGVFLNDTFVGEIQGQATRIQVTDDAAAGENCVTLIGILSTAGGTYRGCFHETCCELVCEDLPCDPPRSLLLCQIAYGEASDANAIRAAWINGEAEYDAISVSVDDEALAPALAGDSQGTVIGLFAPGEHTVSVEGDCGENGTSTATEETITLLAQSPHPTPITGSATCTFSDENGGATVAKWTNADPSNFIDVFLFDGTTLFFVGSLIGSSQEVTITNTTAEDTIVLQFFADVDGGCYGSPLFECVPAASLGRYLPGACNGSEAVTLTSSVFLLNFLFLGGDAPPCKKACDCTGEGEINLSDAICNLNFLFLGRDAPFGWIEGEPTCVAVAEGDDCEEANAACDALP